MYEVMKSFVCKWYRTHKYRYWCQCKSRDSG